MSATIVNAVTREPITEEWRKLAYIDADQTQRTFDPATYPRIGQLWERAAETPSYTPHEGCPQSSGIIRAGERIK